MDLSKYYFCVAGNYRLTFENASATVESFIAKRLSHGLASFEFCSDWGALETRVQELTQSPPEWILTRASVIILHPRALGPKSS